MRPSPSDEPQIATPLPPLADDRRDWTEAACLILTVIGSSYFAIHLIVAAARRLLL